MPNCFTIPSSQVSNKSALRVEQSGIHTSSYGHKPVRFRVMTSQSARPAPSAVPTQLHTDVTTRFGKRLKELRVAHGFTQSGMALRFGIDRSYISDIEHGKKSIRLPLLEVIALGFKTNLSELMRDI